MKCRGGLLCSGFGAALILFSACMRAWASSALIDLIVPPYPNGLSEEFGACVGKGPPSHICDYSVGIISDAGGKPALVRTGRYQGLDSSGRARWLLTDTLAYPRTSDERVLIYATCLLNGQPDPSVFALIDKPEEQAKRAAGWAYRVDLASGKFVKLSPASVKCYQPGGDND